MLNRPGCVWIVASVWKCDERKLAMVPCLTRFLSLEKPLCIVRPNHISLKPFSHRKMCPVITYLFVRAIPFKNVEGGADDFFNPLLAHFKLKWTPRICILNVSSPPYAQISILILPPAFLYLYLGCPTF